MAEVQRVRDFRLDATLGHHAQYMQDFVIAVAASRDPLDGMMTIWDNDFDYTPLNGSTEVFVNSTNAGDTTQEVSVGGLDANFQFAVTTVTLNGQTQVSLGNFTHVQTCVLASGSTPAGDVYVAESDTLTAGVPNTNSKVKAKMIQGNNNTRNGFFMVPDGFIAATTATRGNGAPCPVDKGHQFNTYIHLRDGAGNLRDPLVTVEQTVGHAGFANQFMYPVTSSRLFGGALGAVLPPKSLIEFRALSGCLATHFFFGSDLLLIPEKDLRLGL